MTHVQLEESWTLGVPSIRTVIFMHRVAFVLDSCARVIGCSDVLDAVGRRSRETIRKSQFARNLGRHELAFRTVQLVDTDGGEEDGGGDFVTKEFR